RMIKTGPALEASLGGGRSLTVLSSPNVDSKRQPVPGTKHPVRIRLVTWPDGTHPILLDVNLDEELVKITHECDMSDAMDSIGYARPVLLEVQQVAVMPEKDRKSTRLNSSHVSISYAVFCLKKKMNTADRIVVVKRGVR